MSILTILTIFAREWQVDIDFWGRVMYDRLANKGTEAALEVCPAQSAGALLIQSYMKEECNYG